MISQQPGTKPQLTPHELEQVKEMQKWAQIGKERRLAAGLPIEGMTLRLPLMRVHIIDIR